MGVEVSVGLDSHVEGWLGHGFPTTYHFLDLNLDEPEDFDVDWVERAQNIAAMLRPAWVCGDAGLWHFGPRERGHMLLLPPILSEESAEALARGIRTLRSTLNLEVFPENPPGAFFLGDMHILEYFERVCVLADTGMLLDCAHLTMHQKARGLQPLAKLDAFPWERVVEMHVAGGSPKNHEGFAFVEDDHTNNVLDETWEIFEFAVERAQNLKAVVFECERNSMEEVIGGFDRIAGVLDKHPGFVKAKATGEIR